MDNLSIEKRRKIMVSIKGKNTKIEIMLGKILWSKGFRYRKNNKAILGKPDFTFKKYKIAIFCDGDFWHGKDWETLQQRLSTNREFWIQKIQRNMERDVKVNQELLTQGWTILRFWENDIKKNLPSCVEQIELAIQLAKKS